MMTNAGEHTWGIEFDPVLLIKAISHKIVDAMATPSGELNFYDCLNINNPKSIGIITGNGPDSGIALWNMINEGIVEILGDSFRGDISFPKVSVVSLPEMGLSMELDKRRFAAHDTIMKAVETLQDVELLALACHTNHHFTEQIRKAFEQTGGTFVSMAETVIEHIKILQPQSMVFLGIDYVADLKGYSAYADLKNLNIEPLQSEVLNSLHNLAYDVKKKRNLHSAFQKFVKLLDTYIELDKDVVIALTELSVLYQSFRKSRYNKRNVVDSLELYANKIARHSLGI
jgi:aspartate racemase